MGRWRMSVSAFTVTILDTVDALDAVLLTHSGKVDKSIARLFSEFDIDSHSPQVWGDALQLAR